MIHPHIVPQFCKAANAVKQTTRTSNPYPFLEIAMRSVSRFSVLFLTVGVVLASIGLECQDAATAQTPATQTTQVNVLFVNSSVGDDTGNGGERTPFKTITHALRVAQSNTVIMLSKGTYSTETGEKFPLILKTGVSLQGDARTKGRGTTIQGGDEYLSRSFGGQNVAIVAAHKAGMKGVTVTNNNPRGYGLLIESNSPTILENTFANCTQDGISITGNSAAIVRSNYFYGNKANGITIGGTSRPEIKGNVFQQTGFGINIVQDAEPMIVGNQILYNKSGVLVQANARPVLRNNIIQGNKEDGLVAIAQAMPDLGSVSQPGGNEFRNNARYDINAGAAKQVISLVGNTLANERINGRVNTSGTSQAQYSNATPVTRGTLLSTPITRTRPNIVASNTKEEVVVGREIVFSAPEASQTNPQLLPLQPANSLLTQTPIKRKPASKPTNFPIPSSLPISKTNQLPQINYLRIDPNTVEYNSPNSGLLAQAPLSTPISESILPVPNPNVPVGNIGNMPRLPIPDDSTQSQTTNASPTIMPVEQMSSRYRVMVDITSERDQDLVRFLSPGAFVTNWQGRGVMQAGVFSSRYNANEFVKMLYTNGLRAVVEEIN